MILEEMVRYPMISRLGLTVHCHKRRIEASMLVYSAIMSGISVTTF